MFDLERLRIKQFDQFQPRRVFEMPAGLVTVDGAPIPEGTAFCFDHAFVNLKTQDAEIHGSGPGGQPLAFRTIGGEHKALFVWTGREDWPPPENTVPPTTAPEPAPGEEAAWLAAQPGFEEAAAILGGSYSSGDWGAVQRDADVLRAAAKALARSHPAAARYLARRSLDFYHSWMSQATSGGEGTAMEYEIREELKEMRKLGGP